MRIQNNIMALNTHRQYTINTNSVAKSTEKLSSGYRVNRAGDDAAGLAISEKMRAQIRGLNMASKNSSDAISLVQTAEGALQESHNILQRMRELAVQSSSDTNETSIDRAALNAEFQQLITELDDTARTARFNDMGVIDGSYAAVSKSITTTTAPSGISAAVANAGAGKYDFTVTNVAETAGSVVAAKGPTATGATTNAATVSFTAYDSNGSKLNGATAKVVDIKVDENSTMATMTISVGSKTYTAQADMGGVAQGTAKDSVDWVFEGLGTFTYTALDATAAKADDIADRSDAIGVANTIKSSSFQFSNGTDEIVIPKQEAYIELTAKNTTVGAGAVEEKIRVYSGDTYAKFSSGLVLSFEKMGGIQTGATDVNGPFTGGAGGNFSITVGATAGKPMTIQSGANQYDELKINIDRMDAETLGVKFSNVSSQATASKAITEVNDALNKVSTQRAALGALQNRLNYKISNLDTSAENLTAAESRIRDLDMAKEMTNFTKNNILVQASNAMLAQANSAPQGVLQLLQ